MEKEEQIYKSVVDVKDKELLNEYNKQDLCNRLYNNHVINVMERENQLKINVNVVKIILLNRHKK